MMTLSEELAWRGFVNQTTFKDITELDAQKRTFYWGVDPSAPSMQIGNLAAAMMARVFIKHGYTPVLLVGGATGLIGDPDGKAQERDLKTPEEIARNKAGLAAQYERVFDGLKFEVVDNYDWFKDMNYLDFLREVGKHVPMRQMLARDFVQSRLGEDGAGISYAEFSYSLIQGYDFLWLAENKGVTLQLSGADQWGNSVTGVDLIRRKTGQEAHVWTGPLIVNKATGVKFGKTEGGAVWLDPEMTSPYQFYQFWLNVDDDGVLDYLKIYTTLDMEAVDKVATDFEKDKASRSAQKLLAYEVTKLVHGQDKADAVVHATDTLFGGGDLSDADVVVLRTELPVVKASEDVYDVLVSAGLASSKSEARQFVAGGAISVNGQKINTETANPFTNPVNLTKRGKNTFALIEQ
jgi:tyrosyl-tRNA synthetase